MAAFEAALGPQRRGQGARWLGGVATCGGLAAAATLAAPRLHLPPMLLVLLLGAGLRFGAPTLVDRLAPGVAFSARTLLRLGVALLGLRIVGGDLMALGWRAGVLVFASLLATLLGGYFVARRWRLPADISAVLATSVAVCGASAAAATAAMAPPREDLERDTGVAILVVSLLSTTVMILYPPLCQLLGYDDRRTSLLLGAAIHDVAQVVGAGFGVSQEVGITAVTVKLVRVACLMPVSLAWGAFLASKGVGGPAARRRAPAPPLFLIGFLALALVASFGLAPKSLVHFGGDAATWCLAAAVGAIGLKTSLGDLRGVSPALVWVLLTTTLLQLIVVVALTALILP